MQYILYQNDTLEKIELRSRIMWQKKTDKGHCKNAQGEEKEKQEKYPNVLGKIPGLQKGEKEK